MPEYLIEVRLPLKVDAPTVDEAKSYAVEAARQGINAVIEDGVSVDEDDPPAWHYATLTQRAFDQVNRNIFALFLGRPRA